MTFMEIIRMLSGPFIGAVIGYFTNMIAVKMLFYPKREIRLFGRRLPLTPGVIPKGRPRLASSIGEVVEKYLLTKEDIKTHLLNEQTERKIADAAVEKLSGQIKEELFFLVCAPSAACKLSNSAIKGIVFPHGSPVFCVYDRKEPPLLLVR